MSPLCFVFDVDDTLYLERDYVASGFNAVGLWAAQWLAVSDLEAHCVALFEQGVRSNIFDQALSSCGFESSPALIQALVEIYRTHSPHIRLACDVEESLPRIAARWPVAVLTDGPPAAQSAKVQALRVHGMANPVVLTGALGSGFGKPHPRGFAAIEKKVRADKFVYVADNPHKDFAGPQALGWATVRVRRRGGLHYLAESTREWPDIEIPDFATLIPFLSQL